ncbi:hypothetical protein DGWBC_0906 [Dehalogenimonas sp. WBC-2]|nr:hypothetical protein DGWBC_0906 [Dehalogenimonas sp. WBC-2]
MRVKTKKATFSLHSDVLDELDEAMARGVATSKNAFVEEALIKELKEFRRQIREAEWKKGSKDSLLLNDISDIEISFRSADAETGGKID